MQGDWARSLGKEDSFWVSYHWSRRMTCCLQVSYQEEGKAGQHGKVRTGEDGGLVAVEDIFVVEKERDGLVFRHKASGREVATGLFLLLMTKPTKPGSSVGSGGLLETRRPG